MEPDGCAECYEADALLRVLVVRDLLDDVLWRRTAPMPAIETAIGGLQVARRLLLAAGYEASS